MSNLIYPMALPGLTFGSTRSPEFNTGVQKALSGKESRIAYQQYPLMTWELGYELLRDYTAVSDLRALFGFYMAVMGKFGSFLYPDPVFNTVSNMQFGVSNGTVGPYQITATYQNSPVNLLLNSNGPFNASPWVASNMTLGGSATVSPDGTLNSTRITTTNSSNGLASSLGQASAATSTYFTFSLWVKSVATNYAAGLMLVDNTGAVLATNSITATPTWQRFTVTGAIGGGSASVYGELQTVISGAVLEIYGAQLEAGSTASTYTPTTSQPQYGAGTPELIQNFNGTPLIYAGGTPEAVGSGCTIDGTGLCTFATPPGSGQALTWTGSFYYRVRFDDDSLDFSEFLANFWELKKVKLRQVKL